MKLNIFVEESFTTTITRGQIEINTEDYPELEGLDEGQINDYINKQAWDMKPSEKDVYSSLGEELCEQDTEYDNISGEDITFNVSEI
jgi:hypothetical protein